MSEKLIQLQCACCNKIFNRSLALYKHRKYGKCDRYKNTFCTSQCQHKFKIKQIKVKCGFCGKELKRRPKEIKKSKSGNSFCGSSCAAKYNNQFKRQSRRSQIEVKFYNLLAKEFPQLNILPNDKNMLSGLEVDIAIPSLKLAIEWNGIVHFKPIYGKNKLDKVQQIDAKKLKIAANKNINLIVIPDFVSNDKILQKAFVECCNIIKNLY